MAGRKSFTLKVLNQEGVLLYGEYEAVFVPTKRGETAIMPFHTPAILMLGAGNIRIRVKHGYKTVSPIKSGIAYVGDNEVSILIGT